MSNHIYILISSGCRTVQCLVPGVAGKLSYEQLTAAAPSTDRTQDQNTVTAHNVTSPDHRHTRQLLAVIFTLSFRTFKTFIRISSFCQVSFLLRPEIMSAPIINDTVRIPA